MKIFTGNSRVGSSRLWSYSTELDWHHDFGIGVSDVRVKGDVTYVALAGHNADGYNVFAYDIDGVLIWRTSVGDCRGNRLFIADDAVFVCTNTSPAASINNGYCYKLDIDDGSIIWQYDWGNASCAACATDTTGRVIVVGASGSSALKNVRCLTSGGVLVWEQYYDDATNAAARNIVMDGDKPIVCGTSTNKIHIFNSDGTTTLGAKGVNLSGQAECVMLVGSDIILGTTGGLVASYPKAALGAPNWFHTATQQVYDIQYFGGRIHYCALNDANSSLRSINTSGTDLQAVNLFGIGLRSFRIRDDESLVAGAENAGYPFTGGFILDHLGETQEEFDLILTTSRAKFDANGRLAIAGSTPAAAIGDTIAYGLHFFDANLQRIFSKGSGAQQRPDFDVDDNVYLAGASDAYTANTPQVQKVDDDGDLVWENHDRSGARTGVSRVAANGDVFSIAGLSIQRLNSSGVELSFHSRTQTGATSIAEIIGLPNGESIVVYGIHTTATESVRRYDADNNVIAASEKFGINLSGAVIDSDENVYVFGAAYLGYALRKLDTNLDVIWEWAAPIGLTALQRAWLDADGFIWTASNNYIHKVSPNGITIRSFAQPSGGTSANLAVYGSEPALLAVYVDDVARENNAAVDLGSVPASGEVFVFGLQLANRGGSTIEIADITLPAGYTFAAAFEPVTIGAHDATNFTVQVDVSEAGVKSGLLVITHDVEGSPFTLTLSTTVTDAGDVDGDTSSVRRRRFLDWRL